MTENKILNLNTKENLSLIVADSMTQDIKSSETGKRKKFVVNKYFSGATNENMSDYTKPEKMELLIEAIDFISKFHAKKSVNPACEIKILTRLLPEAFQKQDLLSI